MFRKLLLFLLIFSLITISSYSKPTLAQISFKDISGHRFEFEIKKLSELGIIKGFPDGTFKPEAFVTRAEAAVILAGIKKLTPIKPSVSPFTDVPPNHWAYGHIVSVQKAGLMKGYPDGTFKPSSNILRTELAAIMCQAKGIANEASKIKEPIALAQDEAKIPSWAIGLVSISVFPQNQLLNYRSMNGMRVLDPTSPAKRGEFSYSSYMVLYPPQFTKLINVAMSTEPDNLHPWISTIGATGIIGRAWDFIVMGRDENWDLYPGILREVPTVENGLWLVKGDTMEVIFNLRSGLKWQDGTNAVLDDITYSFAVMMDDLTPVTSRGIADKLDFTKGSGAYGVKGFDILGPWSLKFYYKELDYNANLSMPGGGWIYPKHVVEPAYRKMKETKNIDHFRKDETLSRKPIGLGPYKVVDWKHGSYILVERSSEFFFGKPLAETIVFRFMPDTTTLLARVISGKDVDIGIGLTLDQGIALKARLPTHLVVHFYEALLLEHIGFNLENPIMSDLRIRKAIAYGIDREIPIKQLLGGYVEVSHNVFPKGHFAYETNPLKYNYDPVKARALLEEAGWRVGADGIRVKDGVRLVLEHRTLSGNILRNNMQLIWKAQLKEIGIDLDITKNMPAGLLFSRDHLNMRKWPHMIQFFWGVHPTSILDEVFGQEHIPTAENGWRGNNYYAWRNAEASDLLYRAKREMSEIERRKLMLKAQKLISEELPILPLYFHSTPITCKQNFIGLKPSSVAMISWNIYEWSFK